MMLLLRTMQTIAVLMQWQDERAVAVQVEEQ
jgi:hypothetical protein